MIIALASGGAGSSPKSDDRADTAVSTATEETSAQTAATEDDSVPTEYKSALKKAEDYSETMRMPKAGIYDQLVSEYGERGSLRKRSSTRSTISDSASV